MDLRLVILSVACFSCLVPPALGTGLLAKAALAKGALVAKGALAAKGAAVAKGAMLAKGALVAKGALIGKGVLAAKGILAAKKALAAKGVMLAKGVGAAIVAKGVAAAAAKVAAVKGAALAAKGLAAKGAALAVAKGAAVVAAKGAIVKGAGVAAKGVAAAKFGLLSKHFMPVAQPISILPVPVMPSFGRVVETVEVSQPTILGRIMDWFGVITRSLTNTASAAADLTAALGLRTAGMSSPVVEYQFVKPPRFYPVPVVEKVATNYK